MAKHGVKAILPEGENKPSISELSQIFFLSPQELAKLRDQCEKQKRTIKKLEERVDQMSGKKRFDPEEAFSHSKKENLPLSVISNGTYTTTK